MTSDGIRPAALPHSLSRLRLRLTAWYVGTFFAILTLLGIGMFAAITRRFDADLDASLRGASDALARLAATRGARTAVDELRIPERTFVLTDTLGNSLNGAAGAAVQSWIRQLARDAWVHGAAGANHEVDRERILRANARRFRLSDGQPMIAIAIADEIELEDRYAALIAAFGGAALVALLLVAVGGWLLARQSTEPVERTILQMRRFMADAAHELRTPITVVRARAEVALQRSRDPVEYVAALRSIEQEASRLGGIVEDLLMLARADAGERPIERHRIFLDDVTIDAAEAARVIADRKAVRVEVEQFEEAPVNGDATLLRQLVMILLDNAIKFTSANGTVRVCIGMRGSTATLTVADDGAGIGPDQLPHVFERFYRGDPSRTRGGTHDNPAVSEGAGLGLSIAQWIAEQHGALINIDSRTRQGTLVTVQFPGAVIGGTL